MDEKGSLKIKTETLGNIGDIINFLKDLEFAYNSLYMFNFLVATLKEERRRDINYFDERLRYLRDIRKEFDRRCSDLFILDLFEGFWLKNRNRVSTVVLKLEKSVRHLRTC